MSLIFWLAVAIGAVIFLVPDLYANKFKHSLESELVKLSPEYEGTNKLYFRFAFIWILFTLLLMPFLFMLPQKSNHFETIMSATIVVIFSAASLLRGIFAIVKDVFPSTKYFGSRTLYAHSDNGEIKRFGQLVAIVSSSIGALAIMSILIILLM